jgi:hypothetical protein
MDAIDITDSAFSLDIPDTNQIIGGNSTTDYTMFIYIGAAILVAFIGMFIYKFYQNKKNNQNQELDCEGGFCTMGQRPIPTQPSQQ